MFTTGLLSDGYDAKQGVGLMMFYLSAGICEKEQAYKHKITFQIYLFWPDLVTLLGCAQPSFIPAARLKLTVQYLIALIAISSSVYMRDTLIKLKIVPQTDCNNSYDTWLKK